MIDEKKSPWSWLEHTEGWKNLGVAMTIGMTLFGAVKFTVNKIDEYDAHGERIAKLEAIGAQASTLIASEKLKQYQIDTNKTEVDSLRVKVDGMSNDVVNLRVGFERIQAQIEKRR